jgi:hypothetical protein
MNVAPRRIERFFRLQYTPEGEYGEGPSYYSYGTTGALMVLDLSQHWPRGAWWKQLPLDSLLASARWARELQPREVVHGPFNFNDCSLGTYESPAVIHRLAAATRDRTAQGYGDELLELALSRWEQQIGPDPAVAAQAVDGLVWSLLWRDASLPGERLDFLLHTDNRDRRAEVIIERHRAIIRRPRATLFVWPLLPARILDDGAHFQDSDPQGLRSLVLRREATTMATLLVVVRPSEEAVVRLERSGEQRWTLAMRGRSEFIPLTQ